jgi:Arc/MetJ-type ribon-helix-helix transcriptional regulator
MAKQKKVVGKKRGRSAAGRDSLVALRLPRSLIAEIDNWVATKKLSLSRSDAIRRLIEKGLGGMRLAAGHNKKIAAHVSEIAGQTIDSLVDKSAPVHERESRKRRLLKGPQEFRDLRSDLAKPKKPG